MASIKEKNVFNKSFDLVSGETEMEKAVKNL